MMYFFSYDLENVFSRKTTLMSCIVGLRHLDGGDLMVFGRSRNGHLGHLCGYMSQVRTNICKHVIKYLQNSNKR